MGYQFIGIVQVFVDVCIYWLLDVVEWVIGQLFIGWVEYGIIYLINFGFVVLDGFCQQCDVQGNLMMKFYWEIEQSEVDVCFVVIEWCLVIYEYFCGGGFFFCFLIEGGVLFIMIWVNIIKGLGLVL